MSTVNLSDVNVPMETRLAQAKELSKEKSTRAVDALLTGLDTRDEKLRAAVIAGLKAQKAEPTLVARAADTKRAAAQRVAALGGLRMLKPDEQGVAVAALLDDKEAAVREAAAHALCVFGTAAAEAKLISAMKSEKVAGIRYFIAVALGDLTSPAAKSAVTTALASEQDFAAKDALQQSQQKQERAAAPTKAPTKAPTTKTPATPTRR